MSLFWLIIIIILVWIATPIIKVWRKVRRFQDEYTRTMNSGGQQGLKVIGVSQAAAILTLRHTPFPEGESPDKSHLPRIRGIWRNYSIFLNHIRIK